MREIIRIMATPTYHGVSRPTHGENVPVLPGQDAMTRLPF